MPHPIYGPPQHRLEQLHLQVTLPTRQNGLRTQVEVQGRCSTQRPALWTYGELWTPVDQDHGLQPVDTIAWLLLAAFQDQPASQAALTKCLSPGGWEDVALPF